MAVGMLLAGEGVTRDAYVALTEKMFGAHPMREDQSPDGLIVHTAGETSEGWYIYDIWESQEKFEQFLESSIGPAAAALGADTPMKPQYFPIETIVKGAS